MYELVLVTVPPEDGDLSVLSRARILIYPYFHRDHCYEEDGECRCGGLWDNGHTGNRLKGRLWLDRYGKLPEGRSFDEPADEIRRVADIDVRATNLAPCALITADGDIHHLGGKPHVFSCSLADHAEMEDLLMANPDHIAVPFACHW